MFVVVDDAGGRVATWLVFPRVNTSRVATTSRATIPAAINAIQIRRGVTAGLSACGHVELAGQLGHDRDRPVVELQSEGAVGGA